MSVTSLAVAFGAAAAGLIVWLLLVLLISAVLAPGDVDRARREEASRLAAERDALAGQLDEREARRAALVELNDWIGAGNRLRADLFTSTPEEDESNRRITDWANGATRVVEERWPERREAFLSSQRDSAVAYSGKPLWFARHIRWLDARVAWLTDLQREIAVPPRQSSSPAISSQVQT